MTAKRTHVRPTVIPSRPNRRPSGYELPKRYPTIELSAAALKDENRVYGADPTGGAPHSY